MKTINTEAHFFSVKMRKYHEWSEIMTSLYVSLLLILKLALRTFTDKTLAQNNEHFFFTVGQKTLKKTIRKT
jgi:hypothetical protein